MRFSEEPAGVTRPNPCRELGRNVGEIIRYRAYHTAGCRWRSVQGY